MKYEELLYFSRANQLHIVGLGIRLDYFGDELAYLLGLLLICASICFEGLVR